MNKYRISIRSKWWWWPLFAFCVDVSIQQAWHLYRATPAAETKLLDLLAARRSISRVYLSHATQTSFGHPKGSFLIFPYRRCKKCQVGMQDECFEWFHTPQSHRIKLLAL